MVSKMKSTMPSLFRVAEEGMNFLRRAQVMYQKRPQAVRDQCEDRCENNYTMTMRLGAHQTRARRMGVGGLAQVRI